MGYRYDDQDEAALVGALGSSVIVTAGTPLHQLVGDRIVVSCRILMG